MRCVWQTNSPQAQHRPCPPERMSPCPWARTRHDRKQGCPAPRSSRSVSSNLAEAWRKRRYEKAFIAKLSDCEGEAAETQVWLDYALACEYINEETYTTLYKKYDYILGMLVVMGNNFDKWKL